MGPESSELPYGPMKFWAAHRVTNNDHEEEDACEDPVDPLEWDSYGFSVILRSGSSCGEV
uniref:Uncharacterized protein n=1 Tax=Oryza glumipatula TaxID=40148 RepID=A0A0D9ZBL3_9ORYZ